MGKSVARDAGFRLTDINERAATTPQSHHRETKRDSVAVSRVAANQDDAGLAAQLHRD